MLVTGLRLAATGANCGYSHPISMTASIATSTAITASATRAPLCASLTTAT
jgi:hypothetical protein